ncbi:hypothetical protein [Ruminococcus sp.]|uniref:hypothetical protein n=1 Tax=Ruminococcus sp. TaxID=41978 RepID=UPI0025DDC388|nr:hypothetical protein [Ruminococcus sp.]
MSAKAFEALSKSLESELSPQTAHSQEKSDKENNEKIVAARKNLIRFGSLAVLAFVVWLFATIAWFTANKQNSASGMGVSTQAYSFKLKSKGTIPMDAAYTAASEYKDGVPDDDNTPEYYYTGDNNEDVKWRMELSSGEQLQPGECGELTFWVVPDKADTSLDMKFSASMRGFTYQNDTWSESSNATALGYLDTHILYFTNRYPKTVNGKTLYSYSGLISPDFIKFTLTEDDPVTIYWVWPNTFKQMMYCDGDTALGGLNGIARANDTATLNAIKQYVSNNSARLFPSGTSDLATNVANCCGTATPEQMADSITVLDSAYNTADTVIGSAFQGALIELAAEPIAEHEITSP